MKIYTKSGDNGETFVPCFGKVSKSEKIVNLLGEIDELNAWIGAIAENYSDNLTHKDLLDDIQNTLFEIGTALATSCQVEFDNRTKDIENAIDEINEKLPPLKNFILPRFPSQVHIARAVCRRVERSFVSFTDKFKGVGIYLNRLSDYLFMLARCISYQKNKPEIIWKRQHES